MATDIANWGLAVFGVAGIIIVALIQYGQKKHSDGNGAKHMSEELKGYVPKATCDVTVRRIEQCMEFGAKQRESVVVQLDRFNDNVTNSLDKVHSRLDDLFKLVTANESQRRNLQ